MIFKNYQTPPTQKKLKANKTQKLKPETEVLSSIACSV